VKTLSVTPEDASGESPRMGSTRVAFILLPLEERDFAGVGTLQPSLGFKDFHQAARLHSLTNGHPGW
jgi:hypothetical protein